MRLSDREAAEAIRAQLEPLARTGFSVVYAEKCDTRSVLKAAGYWVDGEMYDRPLFAEDTSNRFKREAAIYGALGSHLCITRCMGVELLPDGEEAWAIRLERAPNGNLRTYMEENEAPTMISRIQVAINIAEALQHVHDRGVVWGDLSPRNILSEARYCVPGDEEAAPAKGTIMMELFALGTAICEVTEWAPPYGRIGTEEVHQKLLDGEYPHISEDNPVRSIIQKLWRFEIGSAQEAADYLKVVSNR